MDERTAVKMAQAVMSQLNPKVKVDGKWGPVSQSAYSSIEETSKNIVRSAVKLVAPAFSPDEFQVAYKPLPVNRPTAAMFDMIKQVAKEFDLMPAELTAFVSIESSFNAKAVNGSYKGLMQMGPAAWQRADAFVKKQNMSPIGDYSKWADPLENLRAGAAYMRDNQIEAKRLGYSGPWDAAAMYLAHQQGPSGFAQLTKAAASSSPVAGERIRAMEKNPPPDGSGVTVRPIDFLSRWKAVTDERVRMFV
jgi:soluble lytic murein transglycosylase-like protein